MPAEEFVKLREPNYISIVHSSGDHRSSSNSSFEDKSLELPIRRNGFFFYIR